MAKSSWEYQLRKYLMLLATLVATATYSAGLAPPGGVWQDDVDGWHKAGDPILNDDPRYLAFYYCNATAFVASVVVNVLLLLLNGESKYGLAALRLVMVLDLLGLLGAYAAGSCRDMATTVYTSVLVVVLAAYVGIQTLVLASNAPSPSQPSPTTQEAGNQQQPDDDGDDSLQYREQRKVLMLLATFAIGITYAAALSPPGGFRDDGDGIDHKPGDAVLQDGYKARLLAFFYCNTTAFVASLFIVVLLMSRRLQRLADMAHSVALYVFILFALLGLLGAYAAGSCRKKASTAYVAALVGAVVIYIVLAGVVRFLATELVQNSSRWQQLPNKWLQARASCCQRMMITDRNGGQNKSPELELPTEQDSSNDQEKTKKNEGLDKAKSLVLLLATLAATITYQAGLHPPGGVWPEDDKQNRYKAGDPILFTTHPKHYRAFFYCNSTAFVASLVVIAVVQSKTLLMRHTLEAAMILDLFSLIGAYAAGSCRDVSTSIYTMALAGAVLVYVVIHVVFFTLDHSTITEEVQQMLEKRRKRLLLLAIMVATVTYQAGLTPPGGFWEKQDEDNRAGSSVLSDNYKPLYTAFFYCNATSFMASMSLIILLVNPNLYRPGIKCNALFVCMVVALLGLMGAYAAGSARRVRVSIYVYVLLGAVIAFVVVQVFVFFRLDRKNKKEARSGTKTNESPSKKPKDDNGENSRRKYLMVLAILAASVTYQAGLDPPGSVWQSGDAAGNPRMDASHWTRYQAFFYCNSTSFVASVVVIILLLQQQSFHRKEPSVLDSALLYAMNTVIVVDLLGLLGAYASGSNREWETSGYVIALIAAVLAYIVIHRAVWVLFRRPQAKVDSTTTDTSAAVISTNSSGAVIPTSSSGAVISASS